jgi:transposase-like protein
MPKGQYFGKKMTDQDRQRIIDEYRSGGFIGEICRRHHHSVNTVRDILDAEGLRRSG